MLSKVSIVFIFLLPALFHQCQQNQPSAPPLFSQLDADSTGVVFSNDLAYDRDFNIYTYRNFYNGGGVATADFNRDGFVDLFFTANMESNRLFINQGNFKFLDATEKSGVAGQRAWSTGVSVADINGDGWLDIYVCNSGDLQGDNKQNELFINQGLSEADIAARVAPKFIESAAEYGLADQGYGTHAAFFDYDKDGDLDVYLLNNSYRSIFDFNLMKNQRPVRDEKGGDKFFRNDDNHFVDVSEAVGIYGSEIGFGLGVTVGDVDRDGWLDMFVSNDFFERDYLYINNGDGTFSEDLENQIQSLSVASMGADVADLNNDGFPEIFVTEMLPEDDARFKTKMTFENWDRYKYNLENGYYHQFTRNVLQANQGDGSFSEIGRLAGVEATDWSWGALIADYDNDGLSDLFVANGLYKDIIDQDYINFVSNEEIVKQVVTEDGVNYQKLIDTIPSTPIPNYLFKNQGNLQFKNKAEEWGLATPSHSNGAGYADLDNDGDLDLVINNVNAPAFVYRNNLEVLKPQQNYLTIELVGIGKNHFAIGANISLYGQDKLFYREVIAVRGFQSSVDTRQHFGLGKLNKIDSVVVTWPNDQKTKLFDVSPNQLLRIDQKKAKLYEQVPTEPIPHDKIFHEISDELTWSYRHIENSFVDFDRDRLIYHMISTDGPKTAKADVNGDGREDFFITGAANTPSGLFIQQEDGTFEANNRDLFMQDRGPEDVDCLFFDADGDGDQDLYVARGSNEHLMASNLLADQLYLNKGDGTLYRSAQYLPTNKFESTACVEAADFDQDGDMDLFVGVRLRPGYYGLSTNGYILANDGSGQFRNVTESISPELIEMGMITDARWIDYDQDDDHDLVVVGDWMGVQFLKNNSGKFSKDHDALMQKSEGWWNCIEIADLDQDGDVDIVLGNHGLNSRFEASEDRPLSLYVNDFDANGTPEPIITQFKGDTAYPITLRHDLVMQLPHLKKKYQKYHDYKGQTIHDVFPAEVINRSVHREVYRLQSSLLINNGDGTFAMHDLPREAQYTPIYGILIEDFDGDRHLDILLGGNLYGVKPEVGRYDASFGVFLKGRGDATFQIVPNKFSGFKVKGQIRDLMSIEVADHTLVLVAKNNDRIQVFTYE